MIYMNDDAAVGAFERSAAAYPVGSVVVKEKRAQPPMADSAPEAHDGVGGMIKRPAGYDPQHGDWEYFYFETPDAIETGRIASCVQCHAGAASSDFVFGSWARHDRD